MNFSKNLYDDLKLTAYALGELEGDERAAVEAVLRHDPAARAVVDEIRATSARLQAALGAEARGEVPTESAATAELHAPITAEVPQGIAVGDGTQLESGTQWRAARRSAPTLFRFPQFYYLIGGLAAACFAILVVTRDTKPPAAPTVVKTYREVQLQPAGLTSTDAVAARDQKTDSAEPDAVTVRNVATAKPGSSTGSTPAGEGSNAIAGADTRAPAIGTATATTGRIFDRDLSLLAQAEEKKEAAATSDAGIGPSANPDRVVKVEPYTVGESRGETLGATIANSISIGTNRTVAVVPAPGQVGVTPHQSVQAIPRPSSDGNFGTRDNETVDLAAFSAASHQSLGERFLGLFKAANRPKSSPEQRIAALSENQRAAAAAQMPDAVPVPRPPVVTKKTESAEHSFARGESLGVPAAALSLRGDYGMIESYAFRREGGFLAAAQYRLSTFPLAVETASYANVRRFIDNGRLPPVDAVRVEELINYFPYTYPESSATFTAALEVADAPWAPGHRLVRIGLKGRDVSAADRPRTNLVLLLDVSGSMNVPNKLPLMKESMRMLIGKLRPDDRVEIVTYGSSTQLALPSTPVSESDKIFNSLAALSTSGSTNGADGIQLAYDIAKANFLADGINRVILCTDGDFNVGATSEGDLVRLIETRARSGVLLTVLGFGMGNYKDSTLERFAEAGNGNYGYIDTAAEAEKLLVEQINTTLVTIAKDVKLQVEFNPLRVAQYRLIGYEDRLLKPEDFSNDNVGAGEIGAGHTITALYEIIPVGAEEKTATAAPVLDELRYQLPGEVRRPPSAATLRDPKYAELLTVKLRYKEPSGDVSRKLEFPLADSAEKFAAASADFKFAAAVAEFGMILRQSPHKGNGTMADVLAWAADGARGMHGDPGGHRGEFLDLARRTQLLLR